MVGVNLHQSFKDMLKLFDEENFADLVQPSSRLSGAWPSAEQPSLALQEFIEFLDQGATKIDMKCSVGDLFEVDRQTFSIPLCTILSIGRSWPPMKSCFRIPRFSESRLHQVRQQLLRVRVMGGFVDSPVPTMVAQKATEGKITELEAVVNTLTSAQGKRSPEIIAKSICFWSAQGVEEDLAKY